VNAAVPETDRGAEELGVVRVPVARVAEAGSVLGVTAFVATVLPVTGAFADVSSLRLDPQAKPKSETAQTMAAAAVLRVRWSICLPLGIVAEDLGRWLEAARGV
jgi:hypothetical protein